MNDTMSMAAGLGKRLRDARLARGMTQSEVADGKFSVSYVSAVERGQLRPSLRALERLAGRLHVPMPQLLYDVEAQGAPPTRTRVESDEQRDEWEQRLLAANILARQGKSAEALDALSSLRAHLPTLAPNTQVRWRWRFACAYLALGLADEAQQELQRGLALAGETTNHALRASLRYGLGKAHQLKRQWPQALEIYQECLANSDPRSQSDPTLRLKTLVALGDVCWSLGEYDMSGEYLCQATEVAQTVLDAKRLAALYWLASTNYKAQGDAYRAMEYAIRSDAAYDECDMQRQTTQAYGRLGDVNLRAQRLEKAREHFSTARELAERWHDRAGRVESLCGLAALYLDQERLDEAAAMIELAREDAGSLDNSVLRAETLLVGARMQEARGEIEAARGDFKRAIELLKDGVEPHYLSQAYKAYADFAERQGDGAQAFELLKTAWRLRDSALAGSERAHAPLAD